MKPTYAELEAKLAHVEALWENQCRSVRHYRVKSEQDRRIARRALASQAKAHKRAQAAEAKGVQIATELNKVRRDLDILRGTHPDRRNYDHNAGRVPYVEHFADSRQGSGFTFREEPDPWTLDSYAAALAKSLGVPVIRHEEWTGYTTVAKEHPGHHGVIVGGKRPTWWPQRPRIVNRAHRLTPRMRMPLNRAHICDRDIGGFCGHISHQDRAELRAMGLGYIR